MHFHLPNAPSIYDQNITLKSLIFYYFLSLLFPYHKARVICHFSPWRLLFSPGVLNVEFLVGKVAPGHVSVRAVQFTPSIIVAVISLQTPHTHLPSVAGTAHL
jgi:hypothetical protein